MKIQKKLLKHIYEILIFVLIALPFSIQVVQIVSGIHSKMLEYIQLTSLLVCIIFLIGFYIVNYKRIIKDYKARDKNQIILINKLKEEKENIEKDYFSSIQMNKQMTKIVKRLIEVQKNLRQKNEWLKNFFELSTKILAMTGVEEIVKVIKDFNSNDLSFRRMSIFYKGSEDNLLECICAFGQKDDFEDTLIKKAMTDIKITYRIAQSNTNLKVAIPIISDLRCDGVTFFSISSEHIEKDDIEYFVSICNFITMAIKNAMYYSNLNRQKQEIEQLYEKSTYTNEQLKEMIEELNRSKKELEMKNAEIERFFYETILCLSKAIEYKDRYTKGHCERVVDVALKIADELNLSKEEKDALRIACLLHDIGKIGVKEDILNKMGPLEQDEYEEIKKHPVIGYNIVKDLDFMERIQRVILQHHERVDGKGYPYGLQDDEIDLLAKIIAVADAYDAMTSNRPYRKAFKKEEALNELKRCAGTQFDKSIVEKLILLAQKGMVMFL